jgi:acetyl esterase/lipase
VPARELGLPTAAALMLMSPWVDMAVSSDTYESNRAPESDDAIRRFAEWVRPRLGL